MSARDADADRPVINRKDNTITFRPRILNPYITCSLCMGYFRNATTITECLHTYCRSCIMRYFQESKKDCPVCGHDLSPHPLEMIRHDRMTQSIINKMLSNNWTPAGANEEGNSSGFDYPVAKPLRTQTEDEPQGDDERQEEPEQAAPGVEDASDEEENGEAQDDQAEEDPEQQADRGEKRPADTEPDEPPPKQPKADKVGTDVSFSLNHCASKDGEIALESLQKPYLRTSAVITMLHLKKYLVSKFQGTGLTPEQLVLECRGQDCGNDRKVGDVAEEIWLDDSKDLELDYHSA